MTEEMPVQLPKVIVDDSRPLHTAELRDQPAFEVGDPDASLPDVTLASAPLNPRDRPHPGSSRIGIRDSQGETVGSLNLLQRRQRTWLNDVLIHEGRRGERLAVASYIGVLAALHTVGREMESDPAGLSQGSSRVWQSLENRGLAEPTGEVDQHGLPRYRSIVPDLG